MDRSKFKVQNVFLPNIEDITDKDKDKHQLEAEYEGVVLDFKKQKKEEKVQTLFVLNKQTRQKLDNFCKEKKITKTFFLEQCINQYIK
jgi:hypothetical protein